MARRQFNRSLQDVGNILQMEHVNVTVPDQALATSFYVNTLGFTRDPYIDWGSYNVWVNTGRQQFHLPTSSPQVLRGTIGVITPSLDSLEQRLMKAGKRLAHTLFKFERRKNHIDVTCPWGNRFKCHAPGIAGEMQLGIPYLEFNTPASSSPGIARFYDQVMGCRTETRGSKAIVHMGLEQKLIFKETRRELPEYDGHHIAIYVANFSAPHKILKENGFITEESDENQYRFQTIFDPATGESLFEIEHEVRSLHHPMWDRELINRNADQSFFSYQRDRDQFVPEKK